jgi:hypothetical protein
MKKVAKSARVLYRLVNLIPGFARDAPSPKATEVHPQSTMHWTGQDNMQNTAIEDRSEYIISVKNPYPIRISRSYSIRALYFR